MQLLYTNEEAKYSITRPYESNQICNIISTSLDYKNEIIITDATSCVGGDTVHFAQYFKWVNSVEINLKNFKLLDKNVRSHSINNIFLFNQNYLNIYKKLTQDVIYIDPPWGGVDYKTKKTINIKLDNYGLGDIIKKIKEVHRSHIFIKLPFNVDLSEIKYFYTIFTIKNIKGVPSFFLIHIK